MVPFWSAVISMQWQWWLDVLRVMMIHQQEGNEATHHHLSQSE